MATSKTKEQASNAAQTELETQTTKTTEAPSTEVDNTEVDNTEAPAEDKPPTREVMIAVLEMGNVKFDKNCTDKELHTEYLKESALNQERMGLSAKGNAQALLDARAQLIKAKADKRIAILLNCEEGEADEQFKQKLAEISRELMRALEREDNARSEVCLQVNGHGIYTETEVGGHKAFGVGVKSGKGVSAKRSGIGVYIRADHMDTSPAKPKNESV
ncbi:MAG: hypothetical protein WBM08_00010 [Prochlorococcaceae cyanobacterium]